MKAWLMDAYRKENSIILWVKTEDDDVRIEKTFATQIYTDRSAENILRKHSVKYRLCRKKTYLRKNINLLEVPVPKLSSFEGFVKDVERATGHSAQLYNADITPEQMYLYKNDLKPLSPIEFDDKLDDNRIVPIIGTEIDEYTVPLKSIRIAVIGEKEISKIIIDDKEIEGDEAQILLEFSRIFEGKDPDVIFMHYAFSRMPFLYSRLDKHKIACSLHRWDPVPIRYKGGRSYWTYGQVRYQDYAVRLRGRFLVDLNSFVGSECDAEGIAELSQLSGTLFQQTASRSFGAVFQTALVREMIRRDLAVPFKEKPVEEPLSMLEMLKSDRGGHIYDPKVGFHKDVAEIDFTSMFPWLIYNHNISADSILTEEGPFSQIPKMPLKVTVAYKGLIPSVLKPFIDRRMHYKKNPTALNKQRSKGLKWVLVSCYGYLRFREFKLGLPTSHMAICSLARETILKVIRLAEERGFEVCHAIIDSLFIKKEGITDEEVKDFCTEVELLTGIPISNDGIFKWVVFLTSVVDKDRPLPSTYYGVFRHGGIKARGIEVRQRGVPVIVKIFQQKVLELMARCDDSDEIIRRVPVMCRCLRELIKELPKTDKKYLAAVVRIAKTDYKHNIPQKIIVERLARRGVKLMPGQFISYVFANKGVVSPEEYDDKYGGKPDIEKYRKLLVRSLFVILQPFGVTRERITELIAEEKQMELSSFSTDVRHRYIQLKREHASDSCSKFGLSERLIRKRLEKAGWKVWKGSCIRILRGNRESYLGELYPNVKEKYARLYALLNIYHPGKLEHLQYIQHVHHGMPDFIAFRNREFKFVECKLKYELLSRKQKKCMKKLREMGFNVEVHKMVDHRTKIVAADVIDGEKRVIERQSALKSFPAVSGTLA